MGLNTAKQHTSLLPRLVRSKKSTVERQTVLIWPSLLQLAAVGTAGLPRMGSVPDLVD